MKKIFTLLFVAATLSGMSTAKAAKAKPWERAWDSIAVAKKIIYEDCVVDSVFKIPGGDNRVLKFDMSGTAKNKNGKSYIVNAETGMPFPDSIILPASSDTTKYHVKFIHKRIKPEDEPTKNDGYKGYFKIKGAGDITALNDSVLFKYHNHPTVKVAYSQQTTGFGGLFKMNWTEGYDSCFWSLDGGNTWRYREEVLTDADIATLPNEFKIIIKEPNGCGPITVFEKKGNSGSGISRPITIKNETDATLNIPTNQYIFVSSGMDLVFTVTPKGNQKPVVSTSRNNTLPDKEGVKIHDNGDGTYSVNVLRVREPLEIKIKYSDNANIEADNNKVWANNGMLYIASAISGDAKVYNVLGALNRTVTFSAGETVTLPLPSGVYVVLMNDGKAYKVAVK